LYQQTAAFESLGLPDPAKAGKLEIYEGEGLGKV
jgi:hypothetical protein